MVGFQLQVAEIWAQELVGCLRKQISWQEKINWTGMLCVFRIFVGSHEMSVKYLKDP